MKTYRAIGLMSGTSMDGLDLVDVSFFKDDKGEWRYELLHSQLLDYDKEWRRELQNSFHLSAPELVEFSARLGRFYAEKVNSFINEFSIKKEDIDFIASHGQTIFHQPEKGYTLQIGNGPEIAVDVGITTITDFRTKDVALGGNGAPLIPVADQLLFGSQATSFLNLGGFANISFQKHGQTKSFDICPINIVINDLVKEVDLEYDSEGKLGAKGKVNEELLNQLNALPYYSDEGPKSLGWEWVEKEIWPLMTDELLLEDKVRTLYEHYVMQIDRVLVRHKLSSVFVTGGGAHNIFLIQLLQEKIKAEVIVPQKKIVDYKEAIGFAFLGLLRWLGKVNVWASVTGARSDSSSGIINHP